jgi:hypothetical protein
MYSYCLLLALAPALKEFSLKNIPFGRQLVRDIINFINFFSKITDQSLSSSLPPQSDFLCNTPQSNKRTQGNKFVFLLSSFCYCLF